MASEQGPVSTSAPLFSATLEPATATSKAITQLESDAARLKSLKRARPEQSQNPSNLTSIANAGLSVSPPAKSPRFGGAFSPAYTPAPLTGAAALADELRKREEEQRSQAGAMSENPRHAALASLIASGGAGMSRPQDTPIATTAMSTGMSTVANAISISNPMQLDDKPETSPASVTSLASLASTAQTATASSTVVASPAPMTGGVDSELRDTRVSDQKHLQAPQEDQSNRALSYPGNMHNQLNPPRAPTRGASLPMPGQNQQLVPRSPSQKKHKCPYCDTEFTRHHNLKSHLLTHSQEKPYICETCSMRFRRLHDLKRHSKLHTGERPHICPKCDRKFARGDALARHSKGNGGCAGRRASMGSFGGDEDFDGSNAGEGDEGGMEGLTYTNGNPPHAKGTEMFEEDRRRFSLPGISIKAQHVASNHPSQDNYAAHLRAPSTYPPAGPRQVQSQGGLYPPTAERGTSSSSGTSPSIQNSVVGGHAPTANMSSMPINAGGSIYSQGGMTESPKPLSPAGMHTHQLGHDAINRQRSPSLTTQFQHAHFGRRQSDRPSPPGLAPPDTRYTLNSQVPNQASSQQHPHGAQQGQQMHHAQHPSIQPQQGPSSGRNHPGPPQQGSGSGDSSRNNIFAAGEQSFIAYVQTLEEQVKNLTEKVAVMENKEKSSEEMMKQLSEEVRTLRNQLNTQGQSQHVAPNGHS